MAVIQLIVPNSTGLAEENNKGKAERRFPQNELRKRVLKKKKLGE